LCPEAAAAVIGDYRKLLTAKEEPHKSGLTNQEKTLLVLVAKGQRNKEIAAELGLSVKSVETYRSRLMKKLGCNSPAEAVRYAIREGLVEP
jgi:DNA-binding NarL/FixJ family response regulator